MHMRARYTRCNGAAYVLGGSLMSIRPRLIVAFVCSLFAASTACAPSSVEESGRVESESRSTDGFMTPEEILADLDAPKQGATFAGADDHGGVPAAALDDPDNHWSAGQGAAGDMGAAGSADLRSYSTIIDQGREGACTAYATAGAMQIMAKMGGKRDEMSAAHLWNLQKKQMNIV